MYQKTPKVRETADIAGVPLPRLGEKEKAAATDSEKNGTKQLAQLYGMRIVMKNRSVNRDGQN